MRTLKSGHELHNIKTNPTKYAEIVLLINGGRLRFKVHRQSRKLLVSRTADKSAALVRGRLRTGHRPHHQPVIRRVPLSSSLQDSAGVAAAEETRPGQGADVQLPADIESHDSFKGDL